MKIKSYFIIVLLCIVTLLFATSFVFADNIGRAVYGVYTENYTGVGINNAAAGNDNIAVYAGGVMEEITSDKFDGAKCYQFGNTGWVSYAFANGAQNMSAYSGGRINFSVKVSSDISSNLNLAYMKLQDSGGAKPIPLDSSNVKRVGSNDTGVLADGNWHSYYIEVSSFVSLGLTLNNITNPFIFSTDAPGTVLVDYVYWTKAPTATRSFSVIVKNISDNQVATDEIITWSQSCFRQSWTAAEQYIELDLDQESYQESLNWYVKIYLDNGSATRKGLYCVDSDGSEIVLPMAWRISKDLIPNSDATFQISKDTWGYLYDSGKVTPAPDSGGVAYAYPWAYFYDVSDTSLILERTIVWSLQGCHCFLYTGQDWNWKGLEGYDKKPKIYFAADCSTALAGLTYEANVVTKLIYE